MEVDSDGKGRDNAKSGNAAAAGAARGAATTNPRREGRMGRRWPKKARWVDIGATIVVGRADNIERA